MNSGESFEKIRALTEALQRVVKGYALDPYDTLAALIPVVADNMAAYAMGELESNLQGPAPSREAILREVESEKDHFWDSVVGHVNGSLQP